MTALDADYLVVGAGAAGMAFTDALVDHADVSVVVVDRRHGAGGHWLDAYPFVRLHQASSFYGVASTMLGGGRRQAVGREAGLHERASAPEVCAYYDHVLRDRLVASGKVRFFPGCEYVGGGRFVSLVSGREVVVDVARRVVDARYLAPRIPARTPPPFDVDDDARVVPVNELVHLGAAASEYVVVGSGKTATDACVWLLDNGVDPDAICWVRPREPWMLDRAVVQPDPVVFLGMAADVVEAAAGAATADDLFVRLEAAGVMLRVDPDVTPTMAKAPTLARWELDLLRSIGHVVRLGHVRRAERGRLLLDEGEVALSPGAVVVHCAAEGLRYPPLVPIWRPDVITVQPVRAGFPCLGAALAGFVEATVDGDERKNRLCPPSPYSDTPAGWARMQALGNRASSSFMADPDVRSWVGSVALNPARVPRDAPRNAELAAVVERYRTFEAPGMARLAALGGVAA